ncbi:MAG: type II toxin-antitoxin system RelE/ParE family toxin [Bacteroidota bacterium]
MNNSSYRISQKAIEDLESIWVYTFQNWSKEQADRYYKLIIQEIEYVAKEPFSGKSLKILQKDYRVSKVKSHLIFYRNKENEPVEIVRILHSALDIKRHLE